ncbi:hypothetical protein MA16_Dca024398 [Dendrobium catenatum]|uniref:Uncharacterized protein n=1 Tax=Dendrobium catenatum TaxID=906689 RepID=A0A2I0VP62_9ASPA|nr:hypothetical protein MA16_Dca024398 [Dendrobium catenatum]
MDMEGTMGSTKGEMIELNTEDSKKDGLVGDESNDLASKLKSPPKHKQQQKWNKGKNYKNVKISSDVVFFGCRKPGHMKH